MKRSDLKRYFNRVRQVTEDICRPLEIEDYVVQPVPDVSPPKWHLAHTTWFYEAVILEKFIPDYKLFHPQYYYLFNSYYVSLGKRLDRPSRGNLSRLPASGRRPGRIQRKIHDQSNGSARRFLCHTTGSYPGYLQEFFPS